MHSSVILCGGRFDDESTNTSDDPFSRASVFGESGKEVVVCATRNMSVLGFKLACRDLTRYVTF